MSPDNIQEAEPTLVQVAWKRGRKWWPEQLAEAGGQDVISLGNSKTQKARVWPRTFVSCIGMRSIWPKVSIQFLFGVCVAL
jgi:hypothetical protein